MATELLKKLRLDIDKPLWFVNAPDDCLALFEELETKNRLTGGKPVAQLMFFAYDSTDFAGHLPALAPYIAYDTLFWICYPKQTGRYESDLIKMKPWEIVFECGYRGQTSVSINDNWTGMRFTNAPKKTASLADVPIEDRKVEGIDFVKRTVQLPADAQAEIDKYKGFSDAFYSMSFTNKKEAVIAIVEAKKPETRQRRIQKLIDELKLKSAAPGKVKK